MNVCGTQSVVYQLNESVRLASERMLFDNWAAAFDLPEKKRRGVKEAA